MALGIFLRVFLLLQDVPLWGDQAALAINILQRNYHELLKPLDNDQVAPIGFLWIERFALTTFGSSEIAMRLFPTIAGILALLLFAIWARSLVDPLAAVLATGALAVSTMVLRRCVELKPYGFDLMSAIVILLLVTRFLQTRRFRWLWRLIVLTPLLTAVSYPSLFILASAGIVLLADAWQFRRSRWIVVLFCVIAAGSFLVIFHPVSSEQFAASQVQMRQYWNDSFPPANPLQLLVWLFLAHSGSTFGYPIEGNSPASLPTFAVCVFGLILIIRKSKRIGWLLGLPFLLTLAAAAIRRYPYGGSNGGARVMQHVAPIIILLIGVGAAAMLRAAKPNWHKPLAMGLMVLLAVIGISPILRNAFRKIPPYPLERESRRFVQQDLFRIGSHPTAAVLAVPRKMPFDLQWYLARQDVPLVQSSAESLSGDAFPGAVWVFAPRFMVDEIAESREAGAAASATVATKDDDFVLAVQSRLKRDAAARWQRRDQNDPSQRWEACGFPAVRMTAPATQPAK